ncbi:MAG: anti-sigma factor antagonist [Cytophagales bacterium]|nr:MAG: anti-sigma factor antagonist [Cytophagales bacterium]
MQITSTKEGDFYIIKIYGDVDVSSSLTLDKNIQKAMNEGEKYILIEGTNLNYISSAGLGVFMSYLQDFKDNKIYFSIYALNEKVKDVFQILGLDQLISIVETSEEAKENAYK